MSELSWAALRAVSSSPRPTRSPRLVRLLTLIAALLMAAAALPLLAAESSPEPQSEIQNPKSKIQNPPAWPGNPLAPGAIGLVEREIVGSLQERGVAQNFARYQSYASMKLDTTARPFTGNEVAGNCRLKWYDHMLRNVTRAPAEAEAFTRLLHYSLASDHRGLEQVLVTAREKMDLGRRLPRTFATVDSPDAALTGVEQAIAGAQVGYAKALATITRTELAELSRSLYPVLVSQNTVGHTLQNRSTGRRLCDLMEKMDRAGFYDAADALAPLADPGLLVQLANIPEAAVAAPAGVTGSIVRQIATPAGLVLVGSRGPNTYDLDRIAGVAAVVDLGGDDVYQEGIVSPERPVLVLVDLGGNDNYRGSKPGIQAGAILGVSMLVDVSGNDVYQAQDVAQASCLAGVGILIDGAGNDVYAGFRRVQSQAMGGLAILVDRAGQDRYHGALWTQGLGGPLGFAVLDDVDGADQYYTGGYYLDDYEETRGHDGWGQGVGAGLRAVANGGIGALLDGGGDDVYEFDYLSHGGGYWLGLGFARDFGGNDQRLGATRQKFDGSVRTEPRFQRFGIGFGCHYALGFCFDDFGDDVYHGSIMGLGHGWDCAMGGLFDLAGKDRYESTGGLTQGTGAQASLGMLFDYEGDDFYRGTSQGNAPSSISYHSLPDCGGNFSFVIDYGGEDTYGSRARNDAYTRRGSAGGFIIDRPKQQPAAAGTAGQPTLDATPGS